MKSTAKTARLLTVWTSNLLLTAIVAIAAITFGRTITGWWSTSSAELHGDPDGSASLPAAPRLHEGQAQLLQFGELPFVMRRQSFLGTKAAMFDALGALCVAAASDSAATDRQPGPLEQQMLERVRDLEPAQANRGSWRLYELDGPIPMIAVVHDGKRNSRVLSWGVAFPIELESQEWTLFSGAAVAGGSLPSESPQLPTPEGVQRVMSVTTAGGETMVCYSGSGGIQDWTTAFDDALAKAGWTGHWQGTGRSKHGRFTDPLNGVQIEVAIHGGDPMTAMVIAPAAVGATP